MSLAERRRQTNEELLCLLTTAFRAAAAIVLLDQCRRQIRESLDVCSKRKRGPVVRFTIPYALA